MNITISLSDCVQNGRNLWKHGSKHYRLFGRGVTPNGCWLISPLLVELVDIDAATGLDVYGEGRLYFDGCVGSCPAGHEYIISF